MNEFTAKDLNPVNLMRLQMASCYAEQMLNAWYICPICWTLVRMDEVGQHNALHVEGVI